LLFLLNDGVLTIAGGMDLLERTGLPMALVTQGTQADAIIAMQTAIMECPDLVHRNPEKATALCWLLNAKTQANAALFIPAANKIKSPMQIAYKLGSVDLTTLGALLSLQKQGRLTNNVINQSVWRKVA
jgi:hypothetical protein